MGDGAAFDALTAKVNELAQVCAQLTQENTDLRSQISRLSAVEPQGQALSERPAVDATAADPEPSRISRRSVGLALAGAAAGVVGAAALGDWSGRHTATPGAALSAEDVAYSEAEHHRAHARPHAAADAGSIIDASLASTAPVVEAANSSTGPGVQGTSSGGRGGVFGGSAAQIQLTPGKSSHPRSGERGDLYADSAGRLWFCKKSGARASWQQIA